ncbi:ABC transporter substrate-binding protein [Gordonia sp. CPCC 206044]|uniref:ABC transporter substrate-binding protein n=1 Tax=Gordonia sp. CPCC 206044 TaxID=3140793 RepID=UPI003AF3FA9A
MTRFRLLAALFTTLLVLAGCGESSDDRSDSSTSDETGAHTVDTTFGPVHTDAAPERVVVLLPAYADTVTALDADDTIVGIANFLPKGARATGPWQKTPFAPSVVELGDQFDPINPESIAALQPDLILAGALQAKDQATYDTLSAIAPTYVSQGKTHDADDWQATTRAIGALMWRDQKADAVIADVEKKLADTRAAHPEIEGKSFLQVSFYQGSYLVASSARSQESFMEAIGLTMADVATQNNSLSVEQTAKLDAADLLIVQAERKKSLEEQPNWSSVRAVRDGSVTAFSLVEAKAFRSPSAASIPYLLDALTPQLASL